MSRDHPDPAAPTPGEAPRLALDLLHEVWDVDDAVRDVMGQLAALDRRVVIATDRRRAAQFAPEVLLACGTRASLGGRLGEIAAQVDHLVSVLGTPSAGDASEVITARKHTNAVRNMVFDSGTRGREYALVGRLAAERISDFAEAEMRYEQILRDLEMRDLEAADTNLARLEELDQDLQVRGVAAMLERARRWREDLDAGGRGGGPGRSGPVPDDDYTI